MNDLRIIFMGTPEFAVSSLEILVENKYTVAAVITAPDKQQGRGQNLMSSPVKACALKNNIPVLQPSNLKSPEFLEALKSHHANLQVVVAFRMLPEVVWAMPALGTFNLHASLLPQYRGAAPINWAIINGETETGVTTFFLKQEIDTGQTIFQEKEKINPEDDAGSLYARLMKKGSQLVLKTVKSIEAGNAPSLPQPHTGHLRHAPQDLQRHLCRQLGSIRRKNQKFRRGLSPYPAAWTLLNQKTIKIFKVSENNLQKEDMPGAIASDGRSYLYIKTADAWLSIDELQLEGKKRMLIGEFLRGNKI